MQTNETPQQAYERGRGEEREACAQIADAFADENIRMAQDTIMLDPCLNGQGHQIDGCVHSSMFHAAQNIAQSIRSRAIK